jgi:hypothetical protein
MLPWAHAAVGYLLYRVDTRRAGTRPAGVAVLALVVGTQVPDLVDKPLAWTVGILASGRSLGHSLFALLVVCGVLSVVVARIDARRRELRAFALGYLSHLAADGLAPVVEGEYRQLGYLFWPITAPPQSGGKESFLEFFSSLEASPWVLFGVGLTMVGIAAWGRDGYPGLSDVILPVFGSRDDTVDTEL